jgi:predicted peptidase
VKQKEDIVGIDGTVCRADDGYYIAYDVYQPLIARFSNREYKGMKYNLFVPEHYTAEKQYPLVVYIEDAGFLGENARIALAQGIGGVIWATKEEQDGQECFVLAPQFSRPVTNDNYEATNDVEIVKEIIDYVAARFSIDHNRIYGTGQSMGCMITYELNVRYPGLYAACLLVGGQWNPETLVRCKDKNFWIVVSEGDEKAFPINNQITAKMEEAGARVGRYWWDAKKSPEELDEEVKEALKDDCNIRYTVFEGKSVLPDKLDPKLPLPLQFHTNTWRVAYCIKGLREWLFSVTK